MRKLYWIPAFAGMTIYGFPECLVLWARLELSALPGKLERNRGGEAMNRAKSRVLWARIRPGLGPDESDSSDFFTKS